MNARMLDLKIDNIEQKLGKLLYQKSKINQKQSDLSIFANRISSFLKIIHNNLNNQQKRIVQSNVNSIPNHIVFTEHIISTNKSENLKDTSQISTLLQNPNSIKYKNETNTNNNDFETNPLEIQNLISNFISGKLNITFLETKGIAPKVKNEKNEQENQILNHLNTKLVNNGFENEKSEALRNDENKLPKTIKKDNQQTLYIFREIQPKSKSNYEFPEKIINGQKNTEGNNNNTDENIVIIHKNPNKENQSQITNAENKEITSKKEHSLSFPFIVHSSKNSNEMNSIRQTYDNEKGFNQKNYIKTGKSNIEQNNLINLKINNKPNATSENTFSEMKRFFPLNQPKNVDISSNDNNKLDLKIHQVENIDVIFQDKNNNQIDQISYISFVNRNNTAPKTTSFDNLNPKTNSVLNYLPKNESQINEKNLITQKSLENSNNLLNLNPVEKLNTETSRSTETYQFDEQNIFEQKNKSKHKIVEKSTNYTPNENKIFEIEQQKVLSTNLAKSHFNVENEPIKETPKQLTALHLTRNSELPSKITSLVNSSTNFPLKAEITLSPNSLGMVIVEINVIKNQVEIMFKTETKEAQQILESQIGLLKEKLSNLGFEKQNFEFQNQTYEKNFLNSYANSNGERYNDDFARREFLRSFYSLKTKKENYFENIWREYDFRHQFNKFNE